MTRSNPHSGLPLNTLCDDCAHELGAHGLGAYAPCKITSCPCGKFTLGPTRSAEAVRERLQERLQEKDLRQWREAIAGLTRKPDAIRDAQVGGDHYRKRKIQPWDIWKEYKLDPWLANVVKYVLRAGHKGSALEDLKKARHYLDEAIAQREGGEGESTAG